jgi:hypothetical protein
VKVILIRMLYIREFKAKEERKKKRRRFLIT